MMKIYHEQQKKTFLSFLILYIVNSQNEAIRENSELFRFLEEVSNYSYLFGEFRELSRIYLHRLIERNLLNLSLAKKATKRLSKFENSAKYLELFVNEQQVSLDINKQNILTVLRFGDSGYIEEKYQQIIAVIDKLNHLELYYAIMNINL